MNDFSYGWTKRFGQIAYVICGSLLALTILEMFIARGKEEEAVHDETSLLKS